MIMETIEQFKGFCHDIDGKFAIKNNTGDFIGKDLGVCSTDKYEIGFQNSYPQHFKMEIISNKLRVQLRNPNWDGKDLIDGHHI